MKYGTISSRWSTLLVSSVLALGLSGCGQTFESTPAPQPQTPNIQEGYSLVKFKDNIRFLDSSDKISNIQSDSIEIVSSKDIRVGDVIYNESPFFLRVVLESTQLDGKDHLRTQPASLKDVIAEGRVDVKFSLSELKPYPQNTLESASLSNLSDTTNPFCPKELPDTDERRVRTGVLQDGQEFKYTYCLNLNGSTNVEFDTADNTAEMSVSVGGSGEYDILLGKTPLPKLYWPLPVGALTPILKLVDYSNRTLKIPLKVQIGFLAGLENPTKKNNQYEIWWNNKLQLNGKLGYQYDATGGKLIKEMDFKGSRIGLSSQKFYGKGNPEFAINGKAGLDITIEAGEGIAKAGANLFGGFEFSTNIKPKLNGDYNSDNLFNGIISRLDYSPTLQMKLSGEASAEINAFIFKYTNKVSANIPILSISGCGSMPPSAASAKIEVSKDKLIRGEDFKATYSQDGYPYILGSCGTPVWSFSSTLQELSRTTYKDSEQSVLLKPIYRGDAVISVSNESNSFWGEQSNISTQLIVPIESKYRIDLKVTSGGRLIYDTLQADSKEIKRFTVHPDTGFRLEKIEGCGGEPIGSPDEVFYTAPISGNCTVTASFTRESKTGIIDKVFINCVPEVMSVLNPLLSKGVCFTSFYDKDGIRLPQKQVNIDSSDTNVISVENPGGKFATTIKAVGKGVATLSTISDGIKSNDFTVFVDTDPPPLAPIVTPITTPIYSITITPPVEIIANELSEPLSVSYAGGKATDLRWTAVDSITKRPLNYSEVYFDLDRLNDKVRVKFKNAGKYTIYAQQLVSGSTPGSVEVEVISEARSTLSDIKVSCLTNQLFLPKDTVSTCTAVAVDGAGIPLPVQPKGIEFYSTRPSIVSVTPTTGEVRSQGVIGLAQIGARVTVGGKETTSKTPQNVSVTPSLLTEAEKNATFSATIDPNPTPDGKTVINIPGFVDMFGKAVNGLDRSNILLTEDGIIKEVTVTQATTGTVIPTDVLFVFDTTGSMRDEIAGVRQSIIDFSNNLEKSGLDVRLGAVTFGDSFDTVASTTQTLGGISLGNPSSPPSFDSSERPSFPLTGDFKAFRDFIGSNQAAGGGDDPENGLGATYFGYKTMNWRPNAAKVIIVITDVLQHQAGTGTIPSDSRWAPPTLTAALTELKGKATVHVIGPVASDSGKYVDMKALTGPGGTGGSFINISTDLSAASVTSGRRLASNDSPPLMSAASTIKSLALDLTQIPIQNVMANSYSLSFDGTRNNQDHVIRIRIEKDNVKTEAIFNAHY